MNRAQRNQNRQNAKELYAMSVVCENCGSRGLHWVGMPTTLANILYQTEPDGFWTCPKYYGPDGRRLNP